MTGDMELTQVDALTVLVSQPEAPWLAQRVPVKRYPVGLYCETCRAYDMCVHAQAVHRADERAYPGDA
jgi:hypothetical protein